LDVRERKRVRHEVAEGEALRLDDAHQTPHALLAARAQGRPDRVIAEAGRDELSRDREMARVDPEARERPPGADARQAAFERRWQAQRFDGHVDAATGESLDLEGRVLTERVDHDVGAHATRHGLPLGHRLDGDDERGAAQASARGRAQADGALREDRHGIPDAYAAGLGGGDARRHDVRAHEDLGVRKIPWDAGEVRLRVGNEDVLGLAPVDGVAESPPARRLEALRSVTALGAVVREAGTALPARRDRADEDAFALGEPLHADAELLDRAHGLVADDQAGLDGIL